MKIDGILEGAQLEILASTSPTPTPLGRVYVDITDATAGLMKLYDGTAWRTMQSQKHASRTASTTDTILTTDEVLMYSAASASFTATLPTAASMSGRILYIKKTDTTFNTVTIDGNGAELVDGTATIVLYTYGEWVQIQSNGTAWILLGWGYYAGRTAYTPTGAWSTNTSWSGFWWRTGSSINIEARAGFSGAPNSATCTVLVPTGAVIDTSVLVSATSTIGILSGRGVLYDNSATSRYILAPFYTTTTSVIIYYDLGTGILAALTEAAPVTVASGDQALLAVNDLPMVGWRG